MTPEQFAEKYLTKPEARRYRYNLYDWISTHSSQDIDIRFGVKYELEYFHYFISLAFVWDQTPEGDIYWQNIVERIRERQY